MKTYFFTFGQAHETVHGVPMSNYWVRVVAENYGQARQIFVNQFTKVYMSAPDKWSFQYETDEFLKIITKFPKGEFKHLIQDGTVYNFHLYCNIKGTRTEEYQDFTRDEIMNQIQMLTKWGFVSNCIYYLDGTIDVSLYHPEVDNTMNGRFYNNQRRVLAQKKV